MSTSRNAWFTYDPMQNPSEAFMDYLEGYASSLDIYTVCSRHPAWQPNVGNVLDDFWRVAADYNASIEELDRMRQIKLKASGAIRNDEAGAKGQHWEQLKQ